MGHRGGAEHHIHLGDERIGLTLEFGELIAGIEGIDRQRGGPALRDLKRHWVNGFGVAGHQLTNHVVALGHPGAFVKQARRRQQGRAVQLDLFTAQRFKVGNGLVHALGVGCIRLPLGFGRYAKAERGRGLSIASGVHGKIVLSRPGALIIIGSGNAEHFRGIVGGEGKQADGVQRCAGGYYAAGAEQAKAWLDAVQVVKTGRHTA